MLRAANPHRDTFVPLLLLGGDTLVTFGGLSLGYWLRYVSPLAGLGIDVPDASYARYLPLLLVGVALLIAAFAQFGLYDARLLLRRYQSLNAILKGAAFWLAIYLGVSLVLKFDPPISRLFVALAFGCVVGLLFLWRSTAYALLTRGDRISRLRRCTVLLGWNDAARALAAEIAGDPAHPLALAGVVTLPHDTRAPFAPDAPGAPGGPDGPDSPPRATPPAPPTACHPLDDEWPGSVASAEATVPPAARCHPWDGKRSGADAAGAPASAACHVIRDELPAAGVGPGRVRRDEGAAAAGKGAARKVAGASTGEEACHVIRDEVAGEGGARGCDRREGEVEPAVPVLGGSEELEAILARTAADVLILTRLDLPRAEVQRMVETCERAYVEWKIVPGAFDIFLSGLRLQTVGRVPLLGVEELAIHRLFNRGLKRALDLAGALAGLALAAPVVAVLAVLIKRESPGGPVFFRQTRVGAGHRPFTLWKLRSMVPEAAAADAARQSTARDDARLLRIGAFMRRWNLDELPQFWNVLRGDMSLVGPRPERPHHVERLSAEIPHYLPRHVVKPGMTGWAQVNGLRGESDLAARVQHDIYYIENWSCWLDVQILLLTFVRWKNAY